jgi:hypothetical protein
MNYQECIRGKRNIAELTMMSASRNIPKRHGYASLTLYMRETTLAGTAQSRLTARQVSFGL